jgi:hypothetical protein
MVEQQSVGIGFQVACPISIGVNGGGGPSSAGIGYVGLETGPDASSIPRLL